MVVLVGFLVGEGDAVGAFAGGGLKERKSGSRLVSLGAGAGTWVKTAPAEKSRVGAARR